VTFFAILILTIVERIGFGVDSPKSRALARQLLTAETWEKDFAIAGPSATVGDGLLYYFRAVAQRACIE
jgi:hypothetical protein